MASVECKSVDGHILVVDLADYSKLEKDASEVQPRHSKQPAEYVEACNILYDGSRMPVILGKQKAFQTFCHRLVELEEIA